MKKDIFSGNKVRLKGTDLIGEVLRIKSEDAQILIGHLKSWVALDRIEVIEEEEGDIVVTLRYTNSFDLGQRRMSFDSQLNIRKLKMDEARPLLVSFFDEALLINVKKISVLHGKGKGLLKQLVRDIASDYPEVSNIRDAPYGLGDGGVSEVFFKT